MLDTEPGHHKQNTSVQHTFKLKCALFHVTHMTNTNHPRPTNSNTSKHMSNKHIKTLKRNMRHHATRSPHLRETTHTSWLHSPLLVLLLLFMLAFHFQIPKHVLHLNSAAHLILVLLVSVLVIPPHTVKRLVPWKICKIARGDKLATAEKIHDWALPKEKVACKMFDLSICLV